MSTENRAVSSEGVNYSSAISAAREVGAEHAIMQAVMDCENALQHFVGDLQSGRTTSSAPFSFFSARFDSERDAKTAASRIQEKLGVSAKVEPTCSGTKTVKIDGEFLYTEEVPILDGGFRVEVRA